MTEAEWLVCDDPLKLLAFYRKSTHVRKMRLFACECCRQNRTFMGLVGALPVVRAAEHWAEGNGSRGSVVAAFEALDLSSASPEHDRSHEAMWLGFCSEDAAEALFYTIAWATDENPLTDQRLGWHLRDIFGDPFRPVTFSREWRTATVAALDGQMYASRDFSAMPILADALQDAECDSADVLNHCRGLGPHVRGCWVLDWVLGKA